MREIKFRAWDKDGKEMIEANGFYQKADPKISGNGLHLSDFLGINKDGTIGKEHENIVLMQYTGLKDKNGVEIYEGDLLENNGNKPAEVRFKNGCYFAGNYNTELWTFAGGNKEVIGNIYENPELVERKL